MPNIRSQSISPQGIEVVASDGTVFRITRGELRARVQLETGTRPQKAAKALAFALQAMEDGLHKAQIDRAQVTLEFDDLTGEPTLLKFVDDA